MLPGWEEGKVGSGSCPALSFRLVLCKIPVSNEWMRRAGFSLADNPSALMTEVCYG